MRKGNATCKTTCNKHILYNSYTMLYYVHTRVVQNSSITITNYYITLPNSMMQHFDVKEHKRLHRP